MDKPSLRFLIIFIIFITVIFLRFYNLSWGAPFYFHPDERNIVQAVSQLRFPDQMNPHFFAYSSFPIYIIYFTGVLQGILSQTGNIVLFEHAIVISRIYSAIFSLIVILLLYKIGKKIKNQNVGILAAFLGTFSNGFIQFSHFGTFEMWLTFFSLLLFYFCLQSKSTGIKFAIPPGIILGILFSTKVLSLALSLLLPLTFFLQELHTKKGIRKKILTIITKSLFSFILAVVVFFVTSPFVFFDFSSFLSSMRYEGSVVFGSLSVFYTGEFYNTQPILFQFLNVYPFLINPLLTIFFIPSFFYITYQGIKKKNTQFLLLATFYLLLFLPPAFFFAKWARYMIPTLPFIYLILSVVISDVLSVLRKEKSIYQYTNVLVFVAIFLVSIVFSLSYFITTHAKADTRIEASLWAKNHTPKDAKIISEVYDLGITPFNSYLSNIKLFNFYELDDPFITMEKKKELTDLIAQSDFIILPSQRIFKIRMINKQKFKEGNEFYQKLFNGTLGFKKIYQTPCDIFCEVVYLGNPVFIFEETVNVFDRPTVYIFEKLNH